jgi:hypothetical protein
MDKKRFFLLFIFLLLILRTAYGLVTEIWSPDEMQILLLGLKFYTSHDWPFFGPFVVYNFYQIPGALQALLTGGPLFLFPFAETPFIFLSLITFLALCLLSWYIEKRVTGLPWWLIWGLVMALPWSVQFGTRIINPSYELVFSVLFFIGFFELMPLYKEKLISPGLASFMVGISLVCMLQLQLSWVLLLPFVLAILIFLLSNRSLRLNHAGMFSLGLLAGLLTLIPTLHVYGFSAYNGAASYVVFQTENLLRFVDILIRFLSFSTYEVSYFLGKPSDRFMEMRLYPWMMPSSFLLLGFGFIQVAFFIVSFFLKRNQPDWKFVKWLSFSTVIVICLYFLFSSKGPSSHTFYILYPVSLIYSMFCYQYIFQKKPRLFKIVFIVVLLSGAVYMTGMARYKYEFRSLYVDRERIQKAIDKKDYTLAGKPLVNKWIDGN